MSQDKKIPPTLKLSNEEEADDVYDYFIYNMDDLAHGPHGQDMYIPDRNPGEADSDHDS